MSETANIFSAGDYNKWGRITGYTLGNGLTATLGYDEFGFPASAQIPGVQNMEYKFDELTGNLLSRKDILNAAQDTFTYDNLMKNRLETWQVVNSGTTYSANYAANGNISSKTGLGTYSYNGSQPHAVTGVENTGNLVNETEQRIAYTPFNKVDTITEGDYRLEITYGPDQARKITRLYNNDVLEKTKYFVGGNYEVEIDGSGNERKLHYIYGGDGLAAIYEHTGITGNLYYIHKDHLGSFIAVTDETGAMVEQMSFNAWGRRRNPADWSFAGVSAAYMFDRGFTGHEHLDEFSLINMNGRVYDPILGRFLSPDNYIQAPDYTQSLNRYSYCLNNPLIYTDPSGEFWQFAFSWLGAMAGNYAMGVADNWINKGMTLGQAFSATPAMANMNYHASNNTWSNSQVSAHNLVGQMADGQQSIANNLAGFSGGGGNDFMFPELTMPGLELGGIELLTESAATYQISNSENIQGATKYSDLKKVFYYMKHKGSFNSKSMDELFKFKSNSLVKLTFTNGVKFTYYNNHTAVPQNLKYHTPSKTFLPAFSERNLNKDWFTINSKITHPYAIRIQGYFGNRYPSNCGTIYFPDWNTFYQFNQYIYHGK